MLAAAGALGASLVPRSRPHLQYEDLLLQLATPVNASQRALSHAMILSCFLRRARRALEPSEPKPRAAERLARLALEVLVDGAGAVSYTHLTLPTIYSV